MLEPKIGSLYKTKYKEWFNISENNNYSYRQENFKENTIVLLYEIKVIRSYQGFNGKNDVLIKILIGKEFFYIKWDCFDKDSWYSAFIEIR